LAGPFVTANAKLLPGRGLHGITVGYKSFTGAFHDALEKI
jgi:hypothetical protein